MIEETFCPEITHRFQASRDGLYDRQKKPMLTADAFAISLKECDE